MGVQRFGQLEMLTSEAAVALPTNFVSTPPERFRVEKVILGKGSLDTPERKLFVRRICDAYPYVPIMERLDVAHNRIELDEKDAMRRRLRGKQTLVFGEMAPSSAVRCTQVEDKERPYRWHFSVYGYCFYGCSYCYLTGTDGVWHSPSVKIYVNLPEIVEEIDRQANRLGVPTQFCLGKLQDGLALDPLTAYSTVLIPFFATHRYARLVIQTKSASVERLLDLDHGGHTTLSWSLNPPEIVRQYESNVPSIEDRIDAMRRCAERGYSVHGLIQPFVPAGDWEAVYESFVCELIQDVPFQELSVAGMCIGRRALSILEHRKGRTNAISRSLTNAPPTGQGGTRYRPAIEERLFQRIAQTVQNRWPVWRVATGIQYPSGLRVLKIRPPTY